MVMFLFSQVVCNVPTVLGEPLVFSLNINKASFYIREVVEISGNVTFEHVQIADGLVAIQINASRYGRPQLFAFRTLATGNNTNTNLPVEVSIETLNTSTISSTHIFNVTLRNNLTYAQTIWPTLTIFDANNMPLPNAVFLDLGITLQGGESRGYQQSVYIPNWATPGEAMACVSIYTGRPAEGGTPIQPETQAFFNVVHYDGMPISRRANPDLPPSSNGSYNFSPRLSPEVLPRNIGDYAIYATIRYGSYSDKQQATFSVNYVPYPPLAHFFADPRDTYVNKSVTFSAASSSPEGYNYSEVLPFTSYYWNFGDGTSPTSTSAYTISHTYAQTGMFTVTLNITLNVTDTPTSWSAISKPVLIRPPDPPIADFTWSPVMPSANKTVLFNASSSSPGWNGTHEIPIVNYAWDFGDGNITIVSDSTVSHVYTANASYTVWLTVRDAGSLQGNTSKTVTVYELIGDINGDGRVDGKDIAIASKAFGTRPGDLLWDPRADVNGDNRVDGKDISIIAKYFGTHSSYSQAQTSEFVQVSFTTDLRTETLSYAPQAIFTYVPGKNYAKVPFTFDASCSLPEGVGDTLVSYKWNFSDGTPIQESASPLFTHAFANTGSYIVTLNVTDMEGLWCAISRPVLVSPPDPPIADFVWAPASPTPNQTILFDASSSLLGWNGTHDVPIVSYSWNFSDGNVTTVPSATITHAYGAAANYTVTLTITDANGLQSNKTQVVNVQTQAPLEGDINGDGRVDGKDIAIAAKAFGTRPGDLLWDPRADVNGDDRVDGKDISIISKHFGQVG
jgi:PKD repeat protein